MEELILKKAIKYMGITAAMLLAVAPVAMPVLSSATETTVKADASTVNQSDVQKWTGELKSKINLTSTVPPMGDNEKYVYQVYGSDGIFRVFARNITPDSDFPQGTDTPSLFSMFNDNSSHDNLFFGDKNMSVIITATANDSSITGNLYYDDINKLLTQINGQGVTFHVSLVYVNDSNDPYNINNTGTTLASKDIDVLPATDSNDNDQTTTVPEPGTSYQGTFSPSVDATLYDNDGKVTSTILPKTTAWNIDRKMDIDGVVYYRVANNEWIKKDDGLEFYPSIKTVTTNKQASLYTATGKRVTDRALSASTPWYSDRTSTINGQTMYRVATDEWVSAEDIQ